jgi:fatty acid desaturase
VSLASKRRKQLQFVALVFLLVSFFFYRWYGFTTPFFSRMIPLSVMALGWLLLPQLLYPVLFIWFFVGKFVGEIVSSILLSILYFLFIWIGKLFVKVDFSSGWKEQTNAKEYENMG